MTNKLKVWYLTIRTPRKLPNEESKNAIVVAPGEHWVLVCNGSELSNSLLTYPFSQFVSGPKVKGFENYPTVELCQECVGLGELKEILKGMGFVLNCPLIAPLSWH